MQVKYVAGVGFAAWRTTQQQGHLAICLRVFRQIVIHNQHIFALPHKIFADSATCVRGDIQKGGRVRSGGGHYNRIVHSPKIGQGFDHLGHRALFLADSHINTDAALGSGNILLVNDSVHRNSGFTRLAVADNQFALAFANRHHCVNGFDTGLERLFNGLTVNNTGGYNVQRHIFIGFYRTLAVQCVAERVHHAANHICAYGNTDNFAGAFNGTAFVNQMVRPHQHAADVVVFQVQRHTFYPVAEVHQFRCFYVV